tara:strand:+ start:4283 stop:5014 length:732 start_codon:yes stop_codon:yes gene_type:complete
MFHFFKKHQKPLFEGLCDLHNHLLPGIDDGSKTIAMSLSMLEAYQQLGFKSVIPTPHVYQELYPNTPETVQKAFQELSKAKHPENSPHIPSYGAEYMVDETFIKNLELGVPRLLLCKKYILLEIHFFGGTQLLEQSCFELSQKGIIPILAHPERFQSIETLSKFQTLKQKGLYLQLNALSLLGHYGPQVQQKAQLLLKSGLYDLVATDAHHPNHLKTLQSLRLSKKQGVIWEGIREFQLNQFS